MESKFFGLVKIEWFEDLRDMLCPFFRVIFVNDRIQFYFECDKG